jgi:hypothetical protein
MAKSTAFDTAVLQMIFNGSTPSIGTTIFANPATTPATVLYCALHTADPTITGSQASSEIAYTGYVRLSVVRTSSGFTITGASVSPTSDLTFAACTGGTGTANYASFGTSSTGATPFLYYGALTPPISCSSGVTPVISHTSTLTEA